MKDKGFLLSAGFAVAIAVALLFMPFAWFASVVLAAVIHESGHMIAIWLISGEWPVSYFGTRFAKISLPEMERGEELICALAGPAAGVVLTLLAPRESPIALCAACQSMFNLLPIYPFDGGRILRCILELVLPPPRVGIVCNVVAVLLRIVVVVISVFATIRMNFGFLPLLVAGIVVYPRK